MKQYSWAEVTLARLYWKKALFVPCFVLRIVLKYLCRIMLSVRFKRKGVILVRKLCKSVERRAVAFALSLVMVLSLTLVSPNPVIIAEAADTVFDWND